MAYSVSIKNYKNTVLSDFESFLRILLLLYPQFKNQLFFSHLLFKSFGGHYVSNLIIAHVLL